MGEDWGLRTDTMIVVGIDPVKRNVTYASLPRDTINVPLPGGGRYGPRKINSFFGFAASDPGRYPAGPEHATKDMMGQLLGIRVDYYAWTTFEGFENLVNVMGGVKVNVPAAVVDPKYQVTLKKIGIRFKAGPQVMKGSRALIYVRTRGGDNDFNRSRRQQVFLTAAGGQLLARPNLLNALIAAKQQNLRTDFPITQVATLIELFGSVPTGSAIKGVVLGPKSYSSLADCSCGYALEPNLRAMRKAAAKLFPWAVNP